VAAESLHIFDPRRNFQLQGVTGRGATTTIHDASATGDLEVRRGPAEVTVHPEPY
jgi:hypothetical protein